MEEKVEVNELHSYVLEYLKEVKVNVTGRGTIVELLKGYDFKEIKRIKNKNKTQR